MGFVSAVALLLGLATAGAFLVGGQFAIGALSRVPRPGLDYFTVVFRDCMAEAGAFSGIKEIDALLCFLSNFFQEILQGDLYARMLLVTTLSLAYPVMVAQMLEAYRSGARGPVRWLSVIGLLTQGVGIGFAVPGVWLPAYLWSSRGVSKAADTTLQLLVVIVVFLLTITMVGCGSLLFAAPLSSTWELNFVVFNVLPALFGFLLWPISKLSPRATLATPDGHQDAFAAGMFAQMTLAMVGGISFMHWLGVLGTLLLGTNLLQDPAAAAAAFVASMQSNGPAQALLYDFLALFVGALLFSLAASGLSATLAIVMLTPLLGPGTAVALYLFYRELDMTITALQQPTKARPAAAANAVGRPNAGKPAAAAAASGKPAATGSPATTKKPTTTEAAGSPKKK